MSNIEVLKAKICENFSEETIMGKSLGRRIDEIAADLETLGFNVDYDECGEWKLDDEYQSFDGFIKFTINGEVLYAEVMMLRDGSPHSDYYYHTPELIDVLTEAQYNTPQCVKVFTFKGKHVQIMNDDSAMIESEAFPTVEAAILSLL